MTTEINPMAAAWLQAAADLGIRVVHPYTFIDVAGRGPFMTVGVYLPDFGSPNGTLLVCRFDGPEVGAAADNTEHYRSSLNPKLYEPYDRELYIETLNDWGWYATEPPPRWYTAKPWTG